MKKHTNAYLAWTESDEDFLHHMEWVSEYREIDVRVRKNKFGDIQVFNGVYDKDGAVKMEEYFSDHESSSVEAGMAWGIKRTRSFAGYSS
ncbi:hypothetical protein [Pseudomonas gingeri]